MAWSGFYRLPIEKRIARVVAATGLGDEDAALLRAAHGGLDAATADGLVENLIGTYALPLGLGVHFVVDGEPVVVPMAVEESSVVAAASNAAKWAAAGGGFHTQVDEPVTIGQVEVRDVPDLDAAEAAVAAARDGWMARLDKQIPAMVARGGGLRAIEAHRVPELPDRLVVHMHVDCRDAMGANLVNGLCESIAPDVAAACGGRPGLRILSNLADQRLARASCTVPADAVGGRDVVAAMVEANAFARADPHRAATHNKGIMNGVDPVVVATGNDWRAVEAGAHAYAARDGRYRALTEYTQDRSGDLQASLELPMSVGTVGGVTGIHPMARLALRLLGDPDARRLAGIIASVGLAQNLAAVRALSAEGIQQGHMALHARNLAWQAGLSGAAAQEAAEQMVAEGRVSARRARELAGGP